MSNIKSKRFQQVGIDRLIRIEWLTYISNLILAGEEKETIKASLQDHLSVEIPSSNNKVRGTISKTITILMKVWVNVPKGLEQLKDPGLDLLAKAPKENKMVIHWGMVMAAYPFWAAVASQAGRLLRLQETISASQVQRRTKEQYGERETVSRRVRYLLRSYIDWGVLLETSKKGIYRQAEPQIISDPKLISWMIEAQLHSIPEAKASFFALLDPTSLFPFKLVNISSDQLLKISDRMDVIRHGLDDELIILKEQI